MSKLTVKTLPNCQDFSGQQKIPKSEQFERFSATILKHQEFVGSRKDCLLDGKWNPFYISVLFVLILSAPFISKSYIKIKIKLNFHSRTSSWRLKRFYENLLMHHKEVRK